ncbi:MAG: hypothetical protein F6K55_03155 [Moorea sp. SIO4A3]|nr:hypothetical protein [Moorena sp. SIO4A3]
MMDFEKILTSGEADRYQLYLPSRLYLWSDSFIDVGKLTPMDLPESFVNHEWVVDDGTDATKFTEINALVYGEIIPTKVLTKKLKEKLKARMTEKLEACLTLSYVMAPKNSAFGIDFTGGLSFWSADYIRSENREETTPWKDLLGEE